MAPPTDPPRPQSRFKEGSMNDRVSAVPPVNFLGPDDLAKFEAQFAVDSTGHGLSKSSQAPGKRARPVSTTSLASKRASATRGFLAPLWDKLHLSRTKSNSSQEENGGNGREGASPPQPQPQQHGGPQVPSGGTKPTRQVTQPSREEVLASYRELSASGFFQAHAIHSKRQPRASTATIAEVPRPATAGDGALLSAIAAARASVDAPVLPPPRRGLKRSASSLVVAPEGANIAEETDAETGPARKIARKLRKSRLLSDSVSGATPLAAPEGKTARHLSQSSPISNSNRVDSGPAAIPPVAPAPSPPATVPSSSSKGTETEQPAPWRSSARKQEQPSASSVPSRAPSSSTKKLKKTKKRGLLSRSRSNAAARRRRSGRSSTGTPRRTSTGTPRRTGTGTPRWAGVSPAVRSSTATAATAAEHTRPPTRGKHSQHQPLPFSVDAASDADVAVAMATGAAAVAARSWLALDDTEPSKAAPPAAPTRAAPAPPAEGVLVPSFHYPQRMRPRRSAPTLRSVNGSTAISHYGHSSIGRAAARPLGAIPAPNAQAAPALPAVPAQFKPVPRAGRRSAGMAVAAEDVENLAV